MDVIYLRKIQKYIDSKIHERKNRQREYKKKQTGNKQRERKMLGYPKATVLLLVRHAI